MSWAFELSKKVPIDVVVKVMVLGILNAAMAVLTALLVTKSSLKSTVPDTFFYAASPSSLDVMNDETSGMVGAPVS
jgi:hypothetical protein